jgi:hypothetical protein
MVADASFPGPRREVLEWVNQWLSVLGFDSRLIEKVIDRERDRSSAEDRNSPKVGLGCL